MHDVFPAFIAYRYADGVQHARTLFENLAAAGVCAFFDGAIPLNFSSHVAPVVEAVATECDVFIIVATEMYVDQATRNRAGWIYRELAAAARGRCQMLAIDLTQTNNAVALMADADVSARIHWVSDACAAAQAQISATAASKLSATRMGCASCFEEAALPDARLLNEFAVRVQTFLSLGCVFGAQAGAHAEMLKFLQQLQLSRFADRLRFAISSQGFVAYQLFHETDSNGELQRFLRLQLWDNGVAKAVCNRDFLIHSHQLPLRSYILRGAMLNEEFESADDGQEYAEFDLRWDGKIQHTVNHAVSEITNSGRRQRIRENSREVVHPGGTYTVTEGVLHRSTPLTGNTITFIFFGHEPEKRTQHTILGPPHATSFAAHRRGIITDEHARRLLRDACAAIEGANPAEARARVMAAL